MNKDKRDVVIAGNWKMNMLASEAKAYARDLLAKVPGFSEWCKTVINAPFPLLTAVIDAFSGSGVAVGAQNMSEHSSGAFTGEVSAEQLTDVGVEYVIIGHSERRALYGETDESVNRKTLAALNASLSPIVCVGETLEQRETGITYDLVSLQVKSALFGVSSEQMSKVVIAYEPVWAIGTGKTATPEDAQAVCLEIRSVIGGLYGSDIADATPVLYGGSMNDKNAAELLAMTDIDGGLIGGASLKPESFAVIINAACRE